MVIPFVKYVSYIHLDHFNMESYCLRSFTWCMHFAHIFKYLCPAVDVCPYVAESGKSDILTFRDVLTSVVLSCCSCCCCCCCCWVWCPMLTCRVANHWLDVPERFKYKLCMMMHRCQDGTAPQYLAVHWSPVSETASPQHLLSAASHQLTVPPHRQTTYGGRAFAVAGPSTWNSLPKHLRDPCSSSAVFARLLKTFLFSEY